MRVILLLVLIGGVFAGGFYLGVRYGERRIIEDPKAFFEAYGPVLEETARTKYEKLKRVMLED